VLVLVPLPFLGWMLPCWEQVMLLDGGGAVRPEFFVGLGEHRVRRDGRRRCAAVGVGEVDIGGVTGLAGWPGGRVVAEAATVGMGDFGRYRHHDGFGGGADVFSIKNGWNTDDQGLRCVDIIPRWIRVLQCVMLGTQRKWVYS
jgi:hypothetical protein